MLEIAYSKLAARRLRAMPVNRAKIITAKIRELTVDPGAANNNVTRLQGRDGFRLRVGDWRVLYDLDQNSNRLVIVAIEPRGSAYR